MARKTQKTLEAGPAAAVDVFQPSPDDPQDDAPEWDDVDETADTPLSSSPSGDGQDADTPGVDGPPPAKPARKRKTAAGETPPWPNFNEPPADPAAAAAALAAAQREREANAVLVPRPGYRWFTCRRNCKSGKYRRGKNYLLPDGQNPELFREAD